MILEMFIYMCIWVTVENLFSGIWRILNPTFTVAEKKQGITWSYLYMFPIYLIFPYTFKLLITLYSHLFWIWIILIDYAVGVVLVTLVESAFGFLYDKTFPGYCPWGKYTKEQKGITWLGGYSRWDISLIFGVLMILFHGFIILNNKGF